MFPAGGSNVGYVRKEEPSGSTADSPLCFRSLISSRCLATSSLLTHEYPRFLNKSLDPSSCSSKSIAFNEVTPSLRNVPNRRRCRERLCLCCWDPRTYHRLDRQTLYPPADGNVFDAGLLVELESDFKLEFKFRFRERVKRILRIHDSIGNSTINDTPRSSEINFDLEDERPVGKERP